MSTKTHPCAVPGCPALASDDSDTCSVYTWGRCADANDTLRRCRVCDRHPRVGDWLRNIALPDGNVEHILCRPRARLR